MNTGSIFRIVTLLVVVFLLMSCNGDSNDSGSENNQKLTVISPSTYSIEENTVSIVRLDVSLIDPTITFALAGGADQTSFDLETKLGQLRFIQAPDFEAPTDHDTDNVYELVVRVANETESVEHNINIAITDADEAPFFTSSTEFSLLENSTAVAIITAQDPEQVAINYQIEEGLDGDFLTIDANEGVLSFINAPDFEAPQDHNSDNIYELFIIVSDDTNQTRLKFEVTVLGVNEFSPTIPQTQLNVPENSLFDQTVGVDADGDELSYELTGGSDQAHFTIDSSTGALRFKEGPDYESPTDANSDNQYEVTVSVSDGENNHTETLIFTIDPVNEAPVFTSTATVEITENNQIALTVAATDPEGDDVEFALIGGADAALFDFNVSIRELRFKTIPDFELPTDSDSDNQYLVVVSASDQSLTNEQQISITVIGENDNAPVFATADTLNYFENNTSSIAINGDDIDGDTLQYSITNNANPDLDQLEFSINSNSGELSFINPIDYEAPEDAGTDNIYEVEISVFDGLFTATKTFAIHIKDDPEQLDVVSGGIKTLRFSWPAIPEASHYRLFQNPDGVSGFTAMSENIGNSAGTVEFDVEIPVHLTHWATTTFMVEAYDNDVRLTESPSVGIAPLMLESIGYVKAASPDEGDWFGAAVAVAGDGNTIAVATRRDDSNSTNPENNDLIDSGAVYVYTKTASGWQQQAYLKASNRNAGDGFGFALSLSGDGNLLAVSALGEASAATGVNGNELDNTLDNVGAVYLFERSGTTWSQTHYIKASNSDQRDEFGVSVSLSSDGLTLAVGAAGEQSNTHGINGNQNDNSLFQSGAVYVFSKTDNVWQQRAYIKASNTGDRDRFGRIVALR